MADTVSAKLLFANPERDGAKARNPISSEGFAKTIRTSQTARQGQIRSEKPPSFIPPEPR